MGASSGVWGKPSFREIDLLNGKEGLRIELLDQFDHRADFPALDAA